MTVFKETNMQIIEELINSSEFDEIVDNLKDEEVGGFKRLKAMDHDAIKGKRIGFAYELLHTLGTEFRNGDDLYKYAVNAFLLGLQMSRETSRANPDLDYIYQLTNAMSEYVGSSEGKEISDMALAGSENFNNLMSFLTQSWKVFRSNIDENPKLSSMRVKLPN